MSAAATSDRVIASRVVAWLRVGGSWSAIATAHHERDVDAFERRIRPLLSDLNGDPSEMATAAPVQLALFDRNA
jgi:hypothetical protein